RATWAMPVSRLPFLGCWTSWGPCSDVAPAVYARYQRGSAFYSGQALVARTAGALISQANCRAIRLLLPRYALRTARTLGARRVGGRGARQRGVSARAGCRASAPRSFAHLHDSRGPRSPERVAWRFRQHRMAAL